MDERTCPECAAEYLPHVIECPHCGVPTTLMGESAAQAGPTVRASALPDGAEVVRLRAVPLAWAEELAAVLAEHGIASRIGPPDDCAPGGGCGTSCGVYVRPADLEQALALDHEYVVGQIPEGLSDLGATATDRCPACGSAVPEARAECPDCGLVVGAG